VLLIPLQPTGHKKEAKKAGMKKAKVLQKTGQAATELATWGTLLLIAFGYVMSYGQRFADTEVVRMEAFRKAMQKAYQRNATASYTYKKSQRVASTQGGYGQGSPETATGSASVMWIKGRAGRPSSEDEQSFAYYQVNSQMCGGDSVYPDSLPRQEKTVVNADGSESDVLVPVSVWNDHETRQQNYSSSVTKTENNSGISIDKSATAADTVSGTLYTHFDKAEDEDPWDDEPETPEYVNTASKPYSGSISYSYGDNWTVNH
jgi:hypothetical protein